MGELPIPLGRAFAALGQTMPELLGYAGISATIFVGSSVGLSVVARAGFKFDGLFVIALVALFAILHAIYLVAASRVIARHCDDVVVEKLSLFGWIGATLTILLLIGLIGAGLTVAIIALSPASPLYGACVGTVAAITWTPFLPRLAVAARDPIAAVFAPDLGRFIFCSALTSLPFLAVVGFFGAPLFGPDASYGLFEGGIIGFPLLGLWLFLAVTTMALVPTAVYAALGPADED
jgi:hypothetical protein